MNQVVVLDVEDPDTLTVASTGPSGIGDAASGYPIISGDGRYVVFATNAPNLTSGQALPWRTFLVVRDLVGQSTAVASRRANGSGVWLGSMADDGHSFSGDGSTVAFAADHAEVSGAGFSGVQVFAAPRP